MSEPKDCHKWQLTQMQMGGTQFIASATGRSGRIKMRPSRAPTLPSPNSPAFAKVPTFAKATVDKPASKQTFKPEGGAE